MMMPGQWDQGLADRLLAADPSSGLVSQVAGEIARSTDEAIRDILCARRPGWTMDQANHSVQLVTQSANSLTDVYWDGEKLGSYRVTATSLHGGEVKTDDTVGVRIRRQVACELEKSMALKDPGGWPDYEEVTDAINGMDNASLLRHISEALEGREDPG